MKVGTPGAKASGCGALFWYLLVYEEDEPIGAACVTEYPVDTMVLASPLAHFVVRHVRRWFPRYLKFRVTFCGLPISIAASNLRMLAGADKDAVISAVNNAVEQISSERGTWLIVYKEFDHDEAAAATSLTAAGYVMAESLPMNRIVNGFASFSDMLAAMRSHYRYKIVRSRQRFVANGLAVERTTDPTTICERYTPELHAMYERVTLQAEHRLEVLPREFFLELATRFPNALRLTTILRGDRVLAFAWSLRDGSIYRNLFVGIDYECNEETEAYINLMVEDIAYAMDDAIKQIFLGQSADDFKSRLGCTSDPRYLLIKVTNRFLRWCFRRWQSSFLPPRPPRQERSVFKFVAQEELVNGNEVRL
jgi:predicted N-acyltransferase